MANKSHPNNYHSISTFKLSPIPLKRIKSTLFSLDYIRISIKLSLQYNENSFINDLDSHFNKIKTIPESSCKPSIWNNVFLYRSFYELNNTKMYVLSGLKFSKRYFNIIIHIMHPTKSDLIDIEQVLDDMVQIDSYWVSKLEPTYDFLLERKIHRNRLINLIKKSLQIRHARRSFSYGDDKSETFYVNFRSSSKQARTYLKEGADRVSDKKYVRFEVPMKRIKLNNQNIIKPSDIFLHGDKILEEISMFGISDINIKTSRLDYFTNHYFSKRIRRLIEDKGLHEGIHWAQKQKECPKKCKFIFTPECPMEAWNETTTNKERLRTINRCNHAIKVVNFRTRYCEIVPEWSDLKARMVQAFQEWAN